ncbi:MAG: bifunctional DNA-formamidopyrimidine glycosylase/DNA-(apurinic or apyrimidinic site) lyase [Deltaproteobacteria bacterium]|nr:bifunctional DNA-formamidopyrimidine glycosylase/DNA-(apurinic or apyrimidinic site) lyase [Deltaproteobacteria bacterium]
MPELPEVQTVVSQLKKRLWGAQIVKFTIYDKQKINLPRQIKHRTIADIVRCAKYVVIVLSAPNKKDVYLAIHLRMTGQLLISRDHKAACLNKSRVDFYTERGILQFCDVRRFGTISYAKINSFARSELEPLEKGFTVERLHALLIASRCNLKSFLLNQNKLVGVGNIYAAEILHRAQLSPKKLCLTLSKKQIIVLQQSIQRVLKEAIKNRGTTISDYRDTDKSRGKFQNRLRVYGREGKACARCSSIIKRIKQGGRSTYYCPDCQYK